MQPNGTGLTGSVSGPAGCTTVAGYSSPDGAARMPQSCSSPDGATVKPEGVVLHHICQRTPCRNLCGGARDTQVWAAKAERISSTQRVIKPEPKPATSKSTHHPASTLELLKKGTLFHLCLHNRVPAVPGLVVQPGSRWHGLWAMYGL